MSLAVAAAVLARVLLVILFPFSALDKIINWQDALKQANSGALPGGPALLVAAIVVELVTPVCIVANWHDRLAAFVLAGFCAVTALLYHNFWAYGDFWAAGDSKARSHFWDFLKNFGLAGGLLLVILGTHLTMPAFVITHPLSSTAGYAPVGAPAP